MVRFVAFPVSGGRYLYVNPKSVVLVTHFYKNGEPSGESCVFYTGSEDPLIVPGLPEEVVSRLERPND